MAFKIQVKRGVLANMPSLSSGEWYYATDTNEVYIGPTPTKMGPPGGGSATFADAEVPSGTLNGTNVTFTLAHTPNPSASLQLFRNGVLQKAGGTDYTLATATITFVSAPLGDDILEAFYRY